MGHTMYVGVSVVLAISLGVGVAQLVNYFETKLHSRLFPRDEKEE